jgi:hypothetical protein
MNSLENDLPNPSEQIGPLLDEVIGQLPEEDRAAVLLRFFEKRDFRSVGEAIGASEDAARMRVNRALEKLQILLRQRGVTATAAVLATALATDAVAAAPADLATTFATHALAGASAGGAATFSKFMTLSKFKFCAVSAIAIAALTGQVIQHKSVTRLRGELRSLRDQLENLTAAMEQPVTPILNATADTNALANLRRNESELLRLRAEVTALRNIQQAAKSKTATAASGNSQFSAMAPPVTRLQASVRAQVGTGQTLLTGGWANEKGSRIFILATPRIQGDNRDQIGIQTSVFEVPQYALSQFGLDDFKVEGNESSLQQVFPADQASLLLKQLKETAGARLIAQTRLLTTDGRQAQIQTTDEQSPGPDSHSFAVDVVPTISADKNAIDLTLNAGVDRPSVR